ncbi:hypothetical protein HC251_24545 [Iamia sp. SCSIO 61187]|uniref:hypothetical protein n=1 Tax=Iamia sp. SCSIO 61187 TaxID=2722752 RepID=UPI001C63297F|nr:hypothetical protein [Iamia sp. SCSIO 61187]QYG95287.1 hypothetical protein HC251_24545 [Iamia sp. SCSIO 61187]
MPTTTEVEARLRRTAEACEHLVEDLLDRDLTRPPDITGPARRRERARGRWLAAAAVLAALAVGAGLVASTRDAGPAHEVAAGRGVSDVGGTVPAPPGEGLLLPDGTRVDVVVPGPSAHEPEGGFVSLDLDGLPDPRSVELQRGTIADLVTAGATVEQDLGEGRAVVREGNLTSVAVAHHGWLATMVVATAYGGDEDLPASAIAELGRGLAFDVSPEGPIGLRGPGVTVISASRRLRGAGGAGVSVTWSGGGLIAGCASPPPPWRCFADGTVLVQVDGPAAAAEALVAEVRIEAVDGVERPPLSEVLLIPLPTGDDVDVELPVGLGWQILAVSARARVDGEETVHTVTLTPVTPGPPRGPEVVDEAGTTDLLLERDGWRVTLPLAADGADLVARDRWEALRTSLTMEVSGAGVSELAAEGLILLDASVVLGPPEGTDDRLRIDVDSTDPPPCTPSPGTRCLYEDMVVGVGTGAVGQEVLAEARVTGMGSHS